MIVLMLWPGTLFATARGLCWPRAGAMMAAQAVECVCAGSAT